MGYWKIVVPEATTNLTTNPSFKLGATGWSSDGTNQTQLTSASGPYLVRFGLDSWRIEYKDDLDLARYTITLPSATTYTFSIWVYLNDASKTGSGNDYDGGAIQLNIENFTSATINTASTTTTTLGKWVRLEIVFTPDAGDLTGDLVVEAASAPSTNDRWVWIDAAQCEAKAYSTTYCDGDQGGCRWIGAKHASTSIRDANSRAGGRVRDFADDYNFPIERVIGPGMPEIKNISEAKTFTPGSDYQRFSAPKRDLVLISRITGSTLANYHSKREALISILTPGDEPFILRYTGSDVTREITARYAGGLELSGPSGFTERVGLQFECLEDVLFKQIGENAQEFGTWTAASMASITRREIDGTWDDMGQDNTTTSGAVRAIAVDNDNGYVYVGGTFTNWDNIANADYVARYDIENDTWAALGTGMDGAVYALKVRQDGSVFAGGAFTNAGGTACYGLAEWDGSSWNNVVSTSQGGTVYAIEFSNDGDYLYIGGSFTNWDAVANCDYIAYTDYFGWAALGTGITGTVVYALAIDSAGNIYAAGDFTAWNGTSADSLALWDGSSAIALSTSTNNIIRALFIDDDDTLYIGGDFTTLGGETHNYLAQWNGAVFSDVGSSPATGGVHCFAKWNDLLIVGGNFGNIGGLDLDDYGYWNGAAWVWPDISFGSGYPRSLAVDSAGRIYVGMHEYAAVNISDVQTITPGGNARTYPIVEFVASTSTMDYARYIPHLLVNITTGKWIWLNYQLKPGETVTINFNPDNLQAVSSRSGPIWPFLPGSDLSDFYLLPGVDNDIGYFFYKQWTITEDAFIKWKNAYWSLD